MRYFLTLQMPGGEYYYVNNNIMMLKDEVEVYSSKSRFLLDYKEAQELLKALIEREQYTGGILGIFSVNEYYLPLKEYECVYTRIIK